MILIIGGAYQGKRRIAREMLGMSEEEFQDAVLDCGDESRIPDPAELLEKDLAGKAGIVSYHKLIRHLLAESRDPEIFTLQVIAANLQVVIMDEVGYGIVPIDRADRDYREAVGYAGQMLAAQADQVYRVICAAAQKIK